MQKGKKKYQPYSKNGNIANLWTYMYLGLSDMKLVKDYS